MSEETTVVCFDLGGVVVRICRTWKQACEHAGLPVRDDEWMRSSDWQSSLKGGIDSYQRGELACGDYFEQSSRAVGELYTAAEFESLHYAWTQEQYSGVEALIDELNAHPRVTTACLSNTNHAHWLRLSGENGAEEYPAVAKLDVPLVSHQLGLIKPDPRIYMQAMKSFSGTCDATLPRIIFFDDLAANVAAASTAGWRAFEVDYSGDTAGQMREFLRAEECLAP